MLVEEAEKIINENVNNKSDGEPEVKVDVPVELEKQEPEKKEEEKKPEIKKNHNERRWDKVLSEGNRLKAAAARYAEENALLRQALAERNPEKQEQSTEKPTRSNYADDAGYIDALVEYKTDQRMADIEKKMQEQTARVKEMTAFEIREADIRKEISDYDEIVNGAIDVPVSESVVSAIKASPNGPAIRYYLAQNPDIAEELINLSPVQAILEIGRLETKINAPAKKPAIRPSGAPEPVKPATGTRGKNTVDRERMSDDEWRKLRHAERKKNR